MSKFERAAAKQMTKQNLKLAKRNRVLLLIFQINNAISLIIWLTKFGMYCFCLQLDPDKLSSTLQELQQQETKKSSDGTEQKVEDVCLSDRLKGFKLIHIIFKMKYMMIFKPFILAQQDS